MRMDKIYEEYMAKKQELEVKTQSGVSPALSDEDVSHVGFDCSGTGKSSTKKMVLDSILQTKVGFASAAGQLVAPPATFHKTSFEGAADIGSLVCDNINAGSGGEINPVAVQASPSPDLASFEGDIASQWSDIFTGMANISYVADEAYPGGGSSRGKAAHKAARHSNAERPICAPAMSAAEAATSWLSGDRSTVSR